MVVRQAVGEGGGAAGGVGGVVRGGPQVGAEEIAAAAAVEEEDLRRIAAGGELAGVTRLQLCDHTVGEEAAVAREPGEQRRGVRDAGWIGEVDAALVEARGDLGQVIFGAGGRGYGEGHGASCGRGTSVGGG